MKDDKRPGKIVRPDEQEPLTEANTQTPKESSDTAQVPKTNQSVGPAAATDDVGVDEPAAQDKGPVQSENKTEAVTTQLQPKEVERKPKKKKKVPKWATVVMAVLIGLSVVGGGFAMYHKQNSSAEKILSDAVVNSLTADSVSFEGSLDFQSSSDEEVFNGLSISGQSDGSGNYKARVDIDIVVSQAQVELVSFDGQQYINAGGLGGIVSNLSSGDSNLITENIQSIVSILEGRWIELNSEGVEGFGLPINLADLDITQDELTKIKDAYLDNSFVSITQDYGLEDLGGAEAYHYKIAINQEKLEAFVEQLKVDGVVDPDNVKQIEEQAEDQIGGGQAPENIELDVWVSQDQRQIRKVEFVNQDDQGTQTLRVEFSGYNEEVNIEAPEDYTTLDSVFSELLTQLGFGTLLSSEEDSEDEHEQEQDEEELSDDGLESYEEDPDDERRSEIDSLYIELLAYVADKGTYPTVAQMEGVAFVEKNMDLFEQDFTDPSGKGINEEGGYTYTVSPSGCDNAPGYECTSFVISADLKKDKRGNDDEDKNTQDYVKNG